MKPILCIALLCLFSCAEKKKEAIKGKWQIISIQDNKSKTEDELDFNYAYDPATDTTKAYITFLNDTAYILTNLFQDGNDTNYYQWKKDTLFTNREPEDYLVKGPQNNDTTVLYNQIQQLTFTLIKADKK